MCVSNGSRHRSFDSRLTHLVIPGAPWRMQTLLAICCLSLQTNLRRATPHGATGGCPYMVLLLIGPPNWLIRIVQVAITEESVSLSNRFPSDFALKNSPKVMNKLNASSSLAVVHASWSLQRLCCAGCRFQSSPNTFSWGGSCTLRHGITISVVCSSDLRAHSAFQVSTTISLVVAKKLTHQHIAAPIRLQESRQKRDTFLNQMSSFR